MSALQRPVRACLRAAAGCLLSLLMIAVPAGAAHAAAPTVTKVTPLKVGIGDTLTITGKHFRTGDNKNTVIFRAASGGQSIFAPTLRSTSTRIVLKVPSRLGNALAVTNGVPQATRFQLRVVGARAAASFTTLGQSPLVLPSSGGSPNSDCDKDGTTDDKDADDDNDGLSDAIEAKYGLNTCNQDSDGDGVWDSFEFESALDINGRAIPFPGKKPWANPLDATDANVDFDGDGLTMLWEFKFWFASGHPFPLNYSDGNKYTGGPVLAPVPDTQSLDGDAIREFTAPTNDPEDLQPLSLRTGKGYISDEEKDFDKDGLSNGAEVFGRMTQAWWTSKAEARGEGAYKLRPFSDTDPLVADTDGDGIVDGLDDQDGDGWSNQMELYRSGVYPTGYVPYMVNPYNPCLPDYHSPTCARWIPVSSSSAPSPYDMDDLPTAPISWDLDNQVPRNSLTPGYVP